MKQLIPVCNSAQGYFLDDVWLVRLSVGGKPLVPSLTFLCAALLAQKAYLIKSARSATAVAIRRLFVYRFACGPIRPGTQSQGCGAYFHIKLKEGTAPPHHNESERSCLFTVWFFVRGKQCFFVFFTSLELSCWLVCGCVHVCVYRVCVCGIKLLWCQNTWIIFEKNKTCLNRHKREN